LRVKCFFYNRLRFKVVIDKSCNKQLFPDTVYMLAQVNYNKCKQTLLCLYSRGVTIFRPFACQLMLMINEVFRTIVTKQEQKYDSKHQTNITQTTIQVDILTVRQLNCVFPIFSGILSSFVGYICYALTAIGYPRQFF